MRIGSTAIEAIVRVAPSTASSPKVMPVAASATARGSSRKRLRKTSSRVAAITSSAAMSRPAMEPVIWPARSLITTGTPVIV